MLQLSEDVHGQMALKMQVYSKVKSARQRKICDCRKDSRHFDCLKSHSYIQYLLNQYVLHTAY